MTPAVPPVESKALLPVGAIARYLACLLLLVVLQVLWGGAVSGKGFDSLNLFVPMAFGTMNLLLGWSLLRHSPMAIWNPLFWLLLACTLYYGLGQLVHLFGHPDTIRRVNESYFVDQGGLARTNLLNTAGVMVIVGAYVTAALLFGMGKGSSGLAVNTQGQDELGFREARWAVIFFLSIGLPVKYFLQMPYDLGLVKWVLPGSVKYLGTLSGVALVPLYWLQIKRGGLYRPLFFSLLGAELLAGLVSLSKLEMIKTVLFVVLGMQWVKPSIKTLVLNGVAIVLAYALVLNPFVNFARVVLERATAENLSEAINLVELYMKQKDPVQDAEFPDAQLWWTRLAYSNVELFAMRQYDKGHPGSTFRLVLYTLIPRFILPSKPIMTTGFEFTYLITDDPNLVSSTGLGVLGEGYWNGGWFGVVLAGTVVGVLLVVYYRLSIRIIGAQIFMLLPISMAGVVLGLRIDGWFVPTYLGTSVQLLLMYVVVQGIVRPALLRGTDRSEHPSATQEGTAELSRRRFPLVSG